MQPYVSPADRLARQILKAATKGLPSQPLTLSIVKGRFAEATADKRLPNRVPRDWAILRATLRDDERRVRMGQRRPLCEL